MLSRDWEWFFLHRIFRELFLLFSGTRSWSLLHCSASDTSLHSYLTLMTSGTFWLSGRYPKSLKVFFMKADQHFTSSYFLVENRSLDELKNIFEAVVFLDGIRGSEH